MLENSDLSLVYFTAASSESERHFMQDFLRVASKKGDFVNCVWYLVDDSDFERLKLPREDEFFRAFKNNQMGRTKMVSSTHIAINFGDTVVYQLTEAMNSIFEGNVRQIGSEMF